MSQPPFGPEDLSQPPLSGTAFLELLASDYTRKTATWPHLYQQLVEGTLSIENLQIWVKDLYLYWDTLYYSTAAIFVKTNEPTTRQWMLRKLVEVEGREIVNDVVSDWTNPAYEELWIRFGEGVGLSREEITSWQTFTRAYFSISTLCMYSRGWEWSWLDGISSLYAADTFYLDYFSKIADSLRKNYDLPDSALSVFDAVITDAHENHLFEQQTLAHWACTTERQLTAARAFRERIDMEYQILYSIDEYLMKGELPFQIPAGTVIPELVDRT